MQGRLWTTASLWCLWCYTSANLQVSEPAIIPIPGPRGSPIFHPCLGFGSLAGQELAGLLGNLRACSQTVLEWCLLKIWTIDLKYSCLLISLYSTKSWAKPLKAWRIINISILFLKPFLSTEDPMRVLWETRYLLYLPTYSDYWIILSTASILVFVISGGAGKMNSCFRAGVLLHCIHPHPTIPLCREASLAARSLSVCPQNRQAAEGCPTPCASYLPVLPFTTQPWGFYQLSVSPLPYKECNLSCTSLPPWLDSWQSAVLHFSPPPSYFICINRPGCIDTRSLFPHADCLPCIGLAPLHQHCLLSFPKPHFCTWCCLLQINLLYISGLSQHTMWMVSVAYTLVPEEWKSI